MKYAVIFEHGPASDNPAVENWSAYVPDLPGVITVGDTREHCEKMIREAIDFHIDGLKRAGLPIPAPSSEVGLVEVTTA